MMSNGCCKRERKRVSVPLMEEGKGLVDVRRLAKMSELKENTEPKTPSRVGHLHFPLGTK